MKKGLKRSPTAQTIEEVVSGRRLKRLAPQSSCAERFHQVFLKV
jgi:hypothetical protein